MMIADLQRLLSRIALSTLVLLPAGLLFPVPLAEAQSVSVTDSMLNSAGYGDEAFLIADVDLDGYSDLVEHYWGVSYGKYPAVNPGLGPPIQERKGNGLRWYKGPELKTITTILTGTQYQSPEYTDFFVEDFDQDGGMDFLGYQYMDRTMRLIRNIADTSPKTIQVITKQHFYYPIETGDLNRDGYPDLVVGAENELCWLENKMGPGTTFTLNAIHSFIGDPSSIIVADLDRDKNQDILLNGYPNGGSSSIFLYRNKGGKNPIFTEDILTTGSFAREVLDFDHDGDPDIIISGSEGIDWLENNGGSPPKFARHHLLDKGPLGKFCDLDGDGDLDILGVESVRHYANETDDVYLFYFENQGGSPPSFQEYRLEQLCVSVYTYPWGAGARVITGTAVGQLRGNSSWQIVVGRHYASDRYFDSTYNNWVVDHRGDIYVYSTSIPVHNGVKKKLWDRYK